MGMSGTWATGGAGEFCRCPECRKMFWVADATRLGVIPKASRIGHWSKTRRVLAHIVGRWEDDFAQDAAWHAVPSGWHSALRIETPDGGDLWTALVEGAADTDERERYLRTRLWWAGNHPLRGYTSESPMDAHQARNNKARLLELIQSVPAARRQPLIEIELLRETGQFEAAIERLENLVPSDDEMAQLQLERATARDALVFKIESEDPMA